MVPYERGRVAGPVSGNGSPPELSLAKGEFVKKDYKKMLYWYKLSAKAGITDAQRDLGYAYFYGHGIKQDMVKAVDWYKKAPKRHDDKALYNIGLCYEHGDGVAKSVRWAKHYFAKAAYFGHEHANEKLKSFSN